MNYTCPRCGGVVEVMHDYDDAFEGGGVRCRDCRNVELFGPGHVAEALAAVLSGEPRVTVTVDDDITLCAPRSSVSIEVNGFNRDLAVFGTYESTDQFTTFPTGCLHVNFVPIEVTPEYLTKNDLTLVEFDLVVAELRQRNLAKCTQCTRSES